MNTKIALVTGGSRGLGKNMALSLADQGKDVIITYHTKEKEAEEVAQQIRETGRKAAVLYFDASDVNGLDKFIESLKDTLSKNWNTDKFDYLVNNAGIGATVPIADMDEETFDKFLNIHFKTVYFLTQKTFSLMNEHGGIVFISSGSTRFSVNGYSVYAAAKGAVEVFARYVAKEYGVKKIRSNVVAPGAIETDFNNAGFKNSPEVQKIIAANTPLGRTGKPDDIGGVVAFLCSDEAKWVNGQKIEVTGGVYL